MKIATWNLERVPKNKTAQIQAKLKSLDADLLILTETSSAIILEGYQTLSSTLLPENFDGINYKAGENRVTISTKFKICEVFQTFDPYTCVCCEVKTPLGILTVYGSIIGVFGNRQPRFNNDLAGQISDFEKIFPGKNVCFGGDLNTTFSGRVFPSYAARQKLTEVFEKFNLHNTTANLDNNIDHLVFSKSFLKNKKLSLESWNTDKKLSDHVGHLLKITA